MAADEFEIIRSLFAPLAGAAGARGLIDDVAVLEAQGALVVTTDAIVEGVHFLPDDPLDLVAKKALRVNLSDLAAKGAKPTAALLTLIWPDARDAGEIADLARGLAEDLRYHEIALLGGDTTSTPGPLTLSITAFGAPHGVRTPSRADAKPGEDVWLSGPVGDALLGLRALQRGVDAPELIARYRLPDPPLRRAPLVAQHAGASMDVSDGLLADAAKLAAASGVALDLEAARIPVSAAAQAWLAETGEARADLFSGGDDYEILLTAAPSSRGALEQAGMFRIGAVAEGAGLTLRDAAGAAMPLGAGGHVHRLGR